MATAVIRTGGKQYRVAQGDVVRVTTLLGNPGDTVTFGDVLAIGGDSPKLGTPLVKDAVVSAQIVNHGLGEKITIGKFRKRKRYKRKAGHRQAFTAVKITDIKS